MLVNKVLQSTKTAPYTINGSVYTYIAAQTKPQIST